MAEKFLFWSSKTPSRINSNKSITRHFIVKFVKTKTKKKTLEIIRNDTFSIGGDQFEQQWSFSKSLGCQKKEVKYTLSAERKELSTQNLIIVFILIRNHLTVHIIQPVHLHRFAKSLNSDNHTHQDYGLEQYLSL